MTCECCGQEGEDDVTQYLLEEAVWERYRLAVSAQAEAADEISHEEMSPGEQQAASHAMRMAQLKGEL